MKGLDFETYSDVDLFTYGLDRYVNDPSFTVLMCSVVDVGSTQRFDFVLNDYLPEVFDLQLAISDQLIAAHNASFERACLRAIGIDPKQHGIKLIDTAALARAAGAAGKLEAAGPQLLDIDKMEEGNSLIRIFSVPTVANGGKPYTKEELEADPELMKKWRLFGAYCDRDTEIAFQLATHYGRYQSERESKFEACTQQMNDVGWHVDIPLVIRMQEIYEQNCSKLLVEFIKKYDPTGKFNINSYKQLKEWCAARGVRAKSFDQLNVAKLKMQIEARLASHHFVQLCLMGDPAALKDKNNYYEVLELLQLKQELGGSSLSKLQTILNLTGEGDRLRNQYLHIGAGQTYRTSGRGAQMQNLPRLEEKIGETIELWNPNVNWTNEKLARNLRQVFTAGDPKGALVVGDFKSVESRGLAYLAGEDWKIAAYGKGQDIYKVLATTFQSFGGVQYDDVTPEQRRAGKVGELACGYGAGPAAVASFAERMGILMSEHEATTIVHDWRDANSKITAFWYTLDDMLHTVVEGGATERSIPLPYDSRSRITIGTIPTPASLARQHPGAQSIEVRVYGAHDAIYLRRVFHGCYMRGRDICFYKPSELKSGDLWRARMSQPPHAWYKIYGGKLAGILTQSFCREIFFDSLRSVQVRVNRVRNVQIIGQFHDEIVVEWTPNFGPDGWTLEQTKSVLESSMSYTSWPSFPLEADIKAAYRYIK